MYLTEELKKLFQKHSNNENLQMGGITIPDLAMSELYHPYLPELPEEIAAPEADDPVLKKQCNDILIETMQSINANSKMGQGIWYFDDYVAYCREHNKQIPSSMDTGYADEEYWEKSGRFQFKIKPGKKPSDAVNAFINGITIADCGNVIVACQLATLLKVFGAEKFDAIFDQELCPLLITQTLSDAANPCAYFFDYGDKNSIPKKGMIGNRPLEAGSMGHIGGLSYYGIKHPVGFSGGFNVICAGKNDQGEDLFLGFGPFFQNGLVTERELNLHFIKKYNLERSVFDWQYIASSKYSSSYEMRLNNVPETVSLKDGLANIKGYLPGSLVTPVYSRIERYAKMGLQETREFMLDYAHFLEEPLLNQVYSGKLGSSGNHRFFHFPSMSAFRMPVVYKAQENVEMLEDYCFGWTRDGKRYFQDEKGCKKKFVPDLVSQVKTVEMTPEEIAEFQQGIEACMSEFSNSNRMLPVP